MALSINDAATDRLVCELAAVTGQGMTVAVRHVLAPYPEGGPALVELAREPDAILDAIAATAREG
jgi:hypothetical protein